MRAQKRPLSLLFVGFASFLALSGVVYFFSPDIYKDLLFFALLALFLFSTGSYLFKSKAHGVLSAGFILSYLVLRLSHLTHPFLLILLFALFFTLELLVSSKK